MSFSDKIDIDRIQVGADYTETVEVSVQPEFN